MLARFGGMGPGLRCRPHLLLLTLALALTLLLTAAAAPLPSVLELDGASFRALLQAERERDVLLLLHERGAGAGLADELARALRLTAASSIVVAALDVAEHGAPAGLHVHHAPPAAVLLPALEGRERVYEHWLEDIAGDIEGTEDVEAPQARVHAHAHVHAHTHAQADGGETCSHDHGIAGAETCGHEHGHDHGHVHGHGHGHGDAPLTAAGLLRFVRAHTSFPAEVPPEARAPIAERWAGRSDELWRAVSGGLDALREQMATLRSELAEARAALREALRACPCAPPPPPPPSSSL